VIAQAPLARPYKGLAAFSDSELDQLLFFGRERDGEIVVANLLAAPLTVLYGASGVGKTSMLAACVVPRLGQEPDAEVIMFASWMGEATAPIRAARDAATVGRDVYLILDQFEEYFLYHAGEEGDGTLPDQLAELLRRRDLRTNVLIAVREDGLARLDSFKAHIPNVLANCLRLPHLDRAGGRAAIEGPLARFRELAVEAQSVTIEPELVEAVLDETTAAGAEPNRPDGSNATGSGAVETPMLQLVMARLWEAEHDLGSHTLRLETFRSLGGARAIVHEHLLQALSALDAAEQDLVVTAFDHLVTPSGSKVALRASDLAQYAGCELAVLEPVLATLARERILRSVGGAGEERDERYELFHDVLADGVLAWRADRRLERERTAAARRHRRLLAVALGSLAALVIVSAIAVFALVERDRERTRSRDAAAREYEASALLGLQSGADDSLALALRAARLEPDSRAEAVLREALIDSRLRRGLPSAGPVQALQFSATGRRLLVAGGSRQLLLYDPATNRLVRAFRDPATVTAAALGPGGLLLSGDADGHVVLRDAASGALRQTLRARGSVSSVAFSSDGRLLLVTTRGGAADVWRASGGPPEELPQPGPVTVGVFDPAARLVATVATDPEGHSRARVFDLRTGTLLHVFPRLGAQTIEFTPDGSLLAVGSHSGEVVLWRPRSGRLVRTLYDQGKNILDLAFTPDGTLLATAAADGGTRVWRVADGSRLYLFSGHTGAVVAVAWSANGGLLADASLDRTTRLFAVQGKRLVISLIATLPGNRGGTSSVAFSPVKTTLATGGVEGGVRLWDASADQRLELIGYHRGPVASASYSPDGQLAVSAGGDDTARIWDVRRRRQLHVLPAKGAVNDARFSPDGKLVVTASMDREARLWRVSDGRLLRTLVGSAPLHVARFSTDGRIVAAGASDGSVRWWRVSDGRELVVVHQRGAVADLAFSPDGTLLATAGPTGATVWSVGSGRSLHNLPVPSGVNRLAFSPDGTLLATADVRATATLWAVASGGRLKVLRGHKPHTAVTDVVFGPDGKVLLTTGTDGDGRTWAIPSGALLQTLRGQFGSLTSGAFSSDGRWIVTAGPISAVLWPAASGELLFYLYGHTEQLSSVAFSPTGWQVLTASKDGSVRGYNCAVCGTLAGLERLAEERLRSSGLGS
jgi:WD40 repeat protein